MVPFFLFPQGSKRAKENAPLLGHGRNDGLTSGSVAVDTVKQPASGLTSQHENEPMPIIGLEQHAGNIIFVRRHALQLRHAGLAFGPITYPLTSALTGFTLPRCYSSGVQCAVVTVGTLPDARALGELPSNRGRNFCAIEVQTVDHADTLPFPPTIPQGPLAGQLHVLRPEHISSTKVKLVSTVIHLDT